MVGDGWRGASPLSSSHGRTTALIDAVALAMAARVDSSSTVSPLRPPWPDVFGAVSFEPLARPTPLLVFRRRTWWEVAWWRGVGWRGVTWGGVGWDVSG